jgi:hypothetical protein
LGKSTYYGDAAVHATAIGGDGKNATLPAGSAATASATADSSAAQVGAASAYAKATSGNLPGKPGGAANATSLAVTANGQAALASSATSGGSGSALATAQTTGLIAVTATSQAPTTSIAQTAESRANSGNPLHTSDAAATTNAYAYGSALSSFALGPNVGAVFNDPANVVFGAGALGASYPTGATSALTYTGSLEWVLDPAAVGLPAQGHLELGLVSSAASKASFSNLSLSVVQNGTSVFAQSFTNVADTTNYFRDHLLDLGAWAANLPAGQNIDLTISLSMTMSAAGSFGFDFVVGDPLGNVPEPTTLGLFAAGGWAMWRRLRPASKR